MNYDFNEQIKFFNDTDFRMKLSEIKTGKFWPDDFYCLPDIISSNDQKRNQRKNLSEFNTQYDKYYNKKVSTTKRANFFLTI